MLDVAGRQADLRRQRSVHHVRVPQVGEHGRCRAATPCTRKRSRSWTAPRTSTPTARRPSARTFAEVEVDTETGQVRVLHLVTAVDLRRGHQSHAGRRTGGRRGGAGPGLRAHRGAGARRRRPRDQPEFPRLQNVLGRRTCPSSPPSWWRPRSRWARTAPSPSPRCRSTAPAPAMANAIFHAIGVRFRQAAHPAGRRAARAARGTAGEPDEEASLTHDRTPAED